MGYVAPPCHGKFEVLLKKIGPYNGVQNLPLHAKPRGQKGFSGPSVTVVKSVCMCANVQGDPSTQRIPLCVECVVHPKPEVAAKLVVEE